MARDRGDTGEVMPARMTLDDARELISDYPENAADLLVLLSYERDDAQLALDVLGPPASNYNQTLVRAENAEADCDRLRALLREVAKSGVELEDPRISYVVVQIDRETWDALKALEG